MFLSLDGTAWIQLLNFAVFFAILSVVFLRPVGDAIKKRREYIEGVQSDYEGYAQQIHASRGEADRKRAVARREAEETVAKARAAAETEAARAVALETDRAQALTEQARATVALEVEAARLREDELSKKLADALLERALGAQR